MKAINPLIGLDYPDPDVIRVGDTYYMVSTTMHFMPGCEILRSYDLAEWEHAAYVYDTLDGTDAQKLTGRQNIYGKGMWAACLRYHQGKYYVCFSSNDTHKTYLFTAAEIEGPWEKHLVEGFYHDCSLLFDDDGRIYIAYGNRNIFITELKSDLSGPREGGIHRLAASDEGNPSLGYEGSHFYKINGKYYLFFIHSQRDRWMRSESCFVADSIEGEFEGRDVLVDDLGYHGHGVAQGGIVDTPEGKWYGILFQDSGAVGRIPVLVPVRWEDKWPVFGENHKALREVEVVSNRPGYVYEPLVQSDDFCFALKSPLHEDAGAKEDVISATEQKRLYGSFGFKSCWQFNHEPDLKLINHENCALAEADCTGAGKSGEDSRSAIVWITTGKLCGEVTEAVNILTQRMSLPKCAGEVTIDASGLKEGDYAGLCAFQGLYAYVAVTRQNGQLNLVMVRHTEKGASKFETVTEEVIGLLQTSRKVRFRLEADFTDMKDEARFFFYDVEQAIWKQIGPAHHLRFLLDHFTGCRFGLFVFSTTEIGGRAGFSDFVRELC